jgi:colanic acid/amylovoran biosynthesis glycosyltransferase
MYNQVKHLPLDIENHIVCERVENLDQFNLPNIHSFSEAPRLYYYYDRLMTRFRIRRHSGYLARQAKRYRADIIHSHFGHIGWQDMGAVRASSSKHVVTFYGLDVNKLPTAVPVWRDRYLEMFGAVDRILCEGSHMALTIEKLGCPAEKIQVQHLGTDVDEISFRPRQWSGNEPLRILISASFREKKGIPFAIEAVARLKGQIPIEVTIIGDAGAEPSHQQEKRRILELIDRLDIKPQIRMLGYQPHGVLFEEAYKHHIFLSPSVTAADGDTEGGAPVTLAEMAATGMPIVSSFHCDIPEVIQHGVTGLLAEERDVSQLVRHLRWFAEHPTEWREMLLAGRRHIELQYNLRVQGDKLANIYVGLAS